MGCAVRRELRGNIAKSFGAQATYDGYRTLDIFLSRRRLYLCVCSITKVVNLGWSSAACLLFFFFCFSISCPALCFFCFYDTTFAIQRFSLGFAIGYMFLGSIYMWDEILYHHGHFNLHILQGVHWKMERMGENCAVALLYESHLSCTSICIIPGPWKVGFSFLFFFVWAIYLTYIIIISTLEKHWFAPSNISSSTFTTTCRVGCAMYTHTRLCYHRLYESNLLWFFDRKFPLNRL